MSTSPFAPPWFSFTCPVAPAVAIVPLATVDMKDSRLGNITWIRCPRCNDGAGMHLIVWKWLTTKPEYKALFEVQP